MLQLPSGFLQAWPLICSLRPSLSVTVSLKSRHTSAPSRLRAVVGVTVPPLPVLGFFQLQVLPVGASFSVLLMHFRFISRSPGVSWALSPVPRVPGVLPGVSPPGVSACATAPSARKDAAETVVADRSLVSAWRRVIPVIAVDPLLRAKHSAPTIGE